MSEMLMKAVDDSLLWVVMMGVIVNSVMLAISLRRWWGFDCRPEGEDEKAWLKCQIGHLTLRRAIRIEVGFLACQSIRLAHTLFVLYDGRNLNLEHAFWAALEREIVTAALVYLSIADLITRRRLVVLQNRLNPAPVLPE